MNTTLLNRNLKALFFIFFGWINLSIAEVCKFVYKGAPEELHGTTITVPDEMVALSEYHYVPSPTDTISDSVGRPAIFFIIDHSSSMYQDANKNTPDFNPANDSLGYRFNVTRDLIHYLYQVFPSAEVGYAVFARNLFYDPRSDPIFEEVTGQPKTNAFLPLLKLNQNYNGRLGYEILTKYLETDTIIPPQWNQWEPDMWVNLAEDPGPDVGIGTHINLGFNAAKKAMTQTQCKKRKQNIIFLSDGDATYPSDNSKFDFVKGANVPKTFTIFFTQSLSVPPNISQMTKNIQTNGYSSTNKHSKSWAFKNTNYDSLMNFLMKNVINQILGEKSNTPTGMAINSSAKVHNWDSVGFTFPKLFPLTGPSTDFMLDIDYHVIKDTINDTGGIVEIEYDTSTVTNLTVRIDPNAGHLPDTFEVHCWDRKIEFYHNDIKIDAADAFMNKLEVRFTEIEIDVRYGYQDVSLELMNYQGNEQDRETVRLVEQGDYHTSTFEIRCEPNPTEDNNILELQQNDSIIAVFKNKEVPLDTLHAAIPYKLKGMIMVKSAAYHDEKLGDGLIDSLFLEVETKGVDLTEEQVGEIAECLVLPKWRKLTILKALLSDDNNIALQVEQDASADTITYVTAEDQLKVNEKILNAGGWLLTGTTLQIKDKIPPLIENAHVIDHQSNEHHDTLTVSFSEKIDPVTKTFPFSLLRKPPSDVFYTMELENIKVMDSTMVFHILALHGTNLQDSLIRKGDSIWISVDDKNVYDIKNNLQDHPDNRRRIITVERRMIDFNLIPVAISPAKLDNIKQKKGLGISHPLIHEIIEILDKTNKDEMKATKNSGMLIQVRPDRKLPLNEEEFRLQGTLSIFDAVGNTVIESRALGYHPKTYSLYFIWPCKNSNGRFVDMGSYLALFQVTATQGVDPGVTRNFNDLQLLLGVKSNQLPSP